MLTNVTALALCKRFRHERSTIRAAEKSAILARYEQTLCGEILAGLCTGLREIGGIVGPTIVAICAMCALPRFFRNAPILRPGVHRRMRTAAGQAKCAMEHCAGESAKCLLEQACRGIIGCTIACQGDMGCEYLCGTEAVSPANVALTNCLQVNNCLPTVNDTKTPDGI
jgi:hypothetical protein